MFPGLTFRRPRAIMPLLMCSDISLPARHVYVFILSQLESERVMTDDKS